MRARFFLPLTALIAPSIAFAAAPRTFSELANLLVQIINSTTTVLIVGGIVVYFWGLSTNILKFSEGGGTEKIKNYFVWGILVLFVMVSIWGIIGLLQSTLFGSSAYAPSGSGVQQTSGSPFQPQFLQ